MDDMINLVAIGTRIKNIRKSKNMTQEQLSEQTKLSLSHISNLENGRSKMSLESLILIAKVLQVPTDAILFGQLTFNDDDHYSDYISLMMDCTNQEKALLIETTSFMKDIFRRGCNENN